MRWLEVKHGIFNYGIDPFYFLLPTNVAPSIQPKNVTTRRTLEGKPSLTNGMDSETPSDI